MTTPRQALGQRGEAIARAHLESQGWRVVATNVHTRYGELDIVALDGDALVFVEVKTRRNRTFGLPEESVTALKQARLRHAAQTYLQRLEQPPVDWRIDVIAIEVTPNGSVGRLEHIRSAVGE